MKTILLLVSSLVLVIPTAAQTDNIPKQEFAIKLLPATLTIKNSTSGSATLTVLKSKSYRKYPASLTIASSLPEGITITFAPKDGVFEESNINVSVSESAKAGTYMIIINASMQNRKKAAILKLIVGANTTDVSSN